YNDWKNSTSCLCDHENSTDYHSAVLCLASRRNTKTRINLNLVSQLNAEQKYWFLAECGLPFHGDKILFLPQNSNFLGCLELISCFDPLLLNHLNKYANTGKGMPDYLSSTICDEFIQLMSDTVLSTIVSKIKCSKYYSTIVGSIPDLTHIDQLIFKNNEEPIERFLKFIPIHGHHAEHLERIITSLLQELDVDTSNCHGQSYDNANMLSGKYSGLQARIKNVLCSVYSLNLVGSCATECCLATGFTQSLYNFFSASAHRWEVLTSHLEKCDNKGLTLKTLSATRWSTRAEATKALQIWLQCHSGCFDQNIRKAAQHEACQLRAAMVKLETAVMPVVWDVILQRMNATSKVLQ
uniref:Uncharacterized protein n=1 Tax=Latimeria chalumnae TaxID=7897 RepID=H3AJZ1_LATCH